MANERAIVTFKFEQDRLVSALDLSMFIFDINRIYATALWGSLDPKWMEIVRSRRPYSFNRFAFSLPAEQSLILPKIRFESPGVVDIATLTSAGVASFWVLLQCIEKIENWHLNRRKLRLEVEKLELEVRRIRSEIEISDRHAPSDMDLDVGPIRGAIRQLNGNPLKPTELSVALNGDQAHDALPEIG